MTNAQSKQASTGLLSHLIARNAAGEDAFAEALSSSQRVKMRLEEEGFDQVRVAVRDAYADLQVALEVFALKTHMRVKEQESEQALVDAVIEATAPYRPGKDGTPAQKAIGGDAEVTWQEILFVEDSICRNTSEDKEAGTWNTHEPGEDDFAAPDGDEHYFSFGNAFLHFDARRRVITWQNGKTLEERAQSRRHPVAKAFFGAMGEIPPEEKRRF